ncbi:heterokaryon incompatibility protein-domain-containing protein [Phyllosticta capitalensis]
MSNVVFPTLCSVFYQAPSIAPDIDASQNSKTDNTLGVMSKSAVLCDACSRSLSLDDWFAGDDGGSGWVFDFPPSDDKQLMLDFIVKEFIRPLPIPPWGGGRSTQGRWIETIPSASRRMRGFLAEEGLLKCATPPKLPELSSAASQSCCFCQRLVDFFREQYKNCPWWGSSESVLEYYFRYAWEKRGPKQEANEGQAVIGNQLAYLSVIVHHPDTFEDEADLFQFHIAAWPDPSGPVSDKNLHFMRRCIENCIKNHEDCKEKIRKPLFVPTRLLDVGSCDDSRVRLVQGSQIVSGDSDNRQPTYATLSYCWGDSLPLRTTENTKAAHEQMGILVHHMPQTFRDAIHVVRKLGIRYLWIDALCIIQENKVDWEIESVRMCDIFANSYVTISAAASSSCSESFLERAVYSPVAISFRSKRRPDIAGEYNILMEQPVDRSRPYTDPYSRWRTRGWVFQEQILSTRQIVFDKGMLSFRCDKGVELESGVHQLAELKLPKGKNYDHLWQPILRSYSAKEFTYPQDKLGAIAGVAKFIENSTRKAGQPEKYLAGLWLDERFQKFPEELCWRCDDPILSYNTMLESLQSKTNYCAPSWSWASRSHTGIAGHTRSGLYTKTCQLISCDLQATYSDPTVSVRFGSSITLRGKLRQIPATPSCGRFEEEVELMHKNWVIHILSWKVSTPHGEFTFYLDWRPNVGDPEEIGFQRQLQLFTVQSGHSEHSGLLLVPFENPRGTNYLRVGVFEHEGESKWLTSGTESDITIL